MNIKKDLPLTEWQRQLNAAVNKPGVETAFDRTIKPTETTHTFYEHFPKWAVENESKNT